MGTNMTTPEGSTYCNQSTTSSNLESHVARHFFIVAYSLVFLVGLFLNGFTLKIYFFRAQRNTTSMTIFLKNLAAADFLISLCLPMRIMNYANNYSIVVRRVYCNFGASAFYLNMYASIMFMGYIAGNRYLKIVQPIGTHILQIPRAARIISIVTWAVLLAMTGTYISLSLLTEKKVPESESLSCDDLHSSQVSRFYRVIHIFSATLFLTVLISLVVFYYKTSRKLSEVQENQPASVSSERLTRSRRNMLVLVSVFFICFVPYHLVRLPYAFLTKASCSVSQVFYYLKELVVFVSVLNVCLDPLIYFIFCRAFRAQMSMRAFSNAQTSTPEANTERRSSDGRLSSIRISRKTSLISMTKQNNVL